MTLNLSPDAEARVKSVTEGRGSDPEETLISLLDQALTMAEAEAEMLAGLRASVGDHDAGRSMTIEEYRAKALAGRRERDAGNAPQTKMAP